MGARWRGFCNDDLAKSVPTHLQRVRRGQRISQRSRACECTRLSAEFANIPSLDSTAIRMGFREVIQHVWPSGLKVLVARHTSTYLS